MADGYEAYQAVCEKEEVERIGCRSHARRKFVGFQMAQPKGKNGKPNQALAMINRLFIIKRSVKNAYNQIRYQVL